MRLPDLLTSPWFQGVGRENHPHACHAGDAGTLIINLLFAGLKFAALRSKWIPVRGI
jgi:hypothetical protein